MVAALAIVLAITACNPTNEKVEMFSIGQTSSSSDSRLYSYIGDAPGWVQVQVASSTADTVRISVETQQDSGPTYCMGDGPYGTDLLANCHGAFGAITSPSRAAQTEGVARGWKKLIAIPAKTRFSIHVENFGGIHAAPTTIAFGVVDGNGNPIGDILLSEGVG